MKDKNSPGRYPLTEQDKAYIAAVCAVNEEKWRQNLTQWYVGYAVQSCLDKLGAECSPSVPIGAVRSTVYRPRSRPWTTKPDGCAIAIYVDPDQQKHGRPSYSISLRIRKWSQRSVRYFVQELNVRIEELAALFRMAVRICTDELESVVLTEDHVTKLKDAYSKLWEAKDQLRNAQAFYKDAHAFCESGHAFYNQTADALAAQLMRQSVPEAVLAIAWPTIHARLGQMNVEVHKRLHVEEGDTG